MSASPLLAYLDHNVLDSMLKGDLVRVGDLLRRAHLTPVFSDENLAEIRRSVGYEQAFIALLDRIEARYLVPILDDEFRHTGSAEVRVIKASDAYVNYVENADSSPELRFGLSEMLQKLYGGRKDESFKEIASRGGNELRELLKGVQDQVSSTPELYEHRPILEKIEGSAPEALRLFAEMAAQLDEMSGVFVKQLDEHFALGPKFLNNIRSPDVLRKVWAVVESKLPVAEFGLEGFFGITPLPFEAEPGREKATVEKVNAIYHQLNVVGYYRDSRLRIARRFGASFRDMTHAGLASFCKVLICRDEALVMKAAAAYEYLGVATQIVHVRSPRNPVAGTQ